MASDDTPPGTLHTRDRLVAAMSDALQRRGLHGVGLNELLVQAQAPKGVLYHHFPGGKTALAVAAIEAVLARISASLDQVLGRQPDVVAALRAWLGGAQKLLEQSGFERGCPLATVALETGPQDTAIRTALAAAFASLREQLARVLAAAGLADSKALGLATLVVAAYEGALMQARVAGSAEPMRHTAEALLGLVEREVQDAVQSAVHDATPTRR